jgi:hypothetical protein
MRVSSSSANSRTSIDQMSNATAISASDASGSRKTTRATKTSGTPVVVVAAAASLVAFAIYFRRGDLLLFGDAVAHLNLARRLFDSLTPGLNQLGTVWLPLPHLMMVPLVANESLWRKGIAGAIPSMIAFVFGVLGMFRLASEFSLEVTAQPQLARLGGWLAAGIYAGNPNLLYLQTTAMNEPLYLTLFMWAMVWLQRFRAYSRHNPSHNCAGRALVACGAVTAAAEITRYDGWFAAGFFAITVLLICLRNRGAVRLQPVILFAAMVAGAPAFWLAYNYKLHGNPLDFATGPYSAHAIEQRSSHPATGPMHPGDHDVKAATKYFIRVVEGDLGQNKERVAMLLIAAIGTLLASRTGWPLLLLWTPLPFYIYSIAYGSIPIFMPELPPWSYYNTRYGTALLPAVAAGMAVAAVFLAGRVRRSGARAFVFVAFFAIAGAAYVSPYLMPHYRGWSFPGEPNAGPLVWREAKVNAVTRQRFETQLARQLEELPSNSRLLMYCGDHVGALQQAGIPLRKVVTDSNGPLWKAALRSPAGEADFIIAIANDPVAVAISSNPAGLEQIASIQGDFDQGIATVYRSKLHAKLREPQ